VIDCIYQVISQLVEDLCALPPSLVVLFQTVQDSVEDKTDIPHSCKSLGLKVSYCIFQFQFVALATMLMASTIVLQQSHFLSDLGWCLSDAV